MALRGSRILSIIVTTVVLVLVSFSACLCGESYLRYPAIHENTIVFTCEGDLWTVAATGGMAARLTQAEGLEYMAKFSPDGALIAFTGEYDRGGNDVYLIQATGGEVRRLTYHPYSDYVLTWAPGGERIIFRSMRNSPHYTYKLFSISVEGAFPEELPIGHASLISFAPDGRRIAFNRFSREFRTWKRYKGGLAQDIWVGDPDTFEFDKITDYEGTDAFPMWAGNRIYFVSDRDATMNIYSMNVDGSGVQQHTFHDDYDVRWPSIGGNRIVYQSGGDIWVLDVSTGDYRYVEIEVPSDRSAAREKFIDPLEYITDFEVSPKGKRVAFCSRGELAVVPAKEGRLINLASTSDVREKFPRWSPDGKSIAYISELSGEEEIYMVDVLGATEPVQITEGTQGWKFPPVWSPDGKKMAYADRSQAIFVVDCETHKITPVDSSDYWEIREYSWSSDSRWLAYAKPENHRFSSVFIYDTETSKVVRITDAYTDDSEPVWDPGGKYLYFLSDRTLNPLIGKREFGTILDEMTKPYLVMLKAGEKSPFFAQEPEDLEEEKDGKNDKSDKGEKGDEEETKEVEIDLEGIGDRVVEFPVDAGHYSNLSAAEGKIFYISRPSIGMTEGQRRGSERKPIRDLRKFDFEEEEDEVVLGGINSYRLSYDGKKIAYQRMRDFYVVDSNSKDSNGSNEKSKVDLSRWHIRIDPKLEWKEMFNEAWRLQRDFYWAPNMANIDWPGVKAKYEKLLPRIATRVDLTDLIGEMIAELATSHTYIWGGDLERPSGISVGLLGADIMPEEQVGLYRITKIYPPEPSSPGVVSPLTLSHAGVEEGEYVLAVNNHPITTSANFFSHFINLADDEVLLTVNGKPTFEGARQVIVKTIGGEGQVRYLDWVRSNRGFVEKATDGKVGYLHIPDMSTAGLVEFARTFYPQIEKPGLIIDARYNGGGFVSELIIQKISRDLLAYGKPRKGKPYRYPDEAVDAHRVVLCNEHAGSDGDIFTRAFKLANLGTVIGTRTWGGVVGIRMDKPFVDGGLMTIPEFAWWEPEGWTMENYGAVPDIEVDNLPGDVMRGHDTQLEKAVAVVMGLMEKEPKEMPRLPAYPDKRKSK